MVSMFITKQLLARLVNENDTKQTSIYNGRLSIGYGGEGLAPTNVPLIKVCARYSIIFSIKHLHLSGSWLGMYIRTSITMTYI
jgi:hypothetical protein